MTDISFEDVQKMIDTLVVLHDETGTQINRYGNTFLIGSQAAREIETFSDQESVITTHAQSSILIEVAADHLMALNKVLTEPVQTIAPWSITRSLLEASAISTWLLDPQISIRERVQRSFAFRYEGLRQQSKFGNAIGQTSEVERIKERMVDVEQKAVSLGFPKVLDRNGRRIGIGQQMPSITELIGMTLNEESSYRLLSSVAHAHPWALQQASFRLSADNNDLYAVKELSLPAIVYLCTLSAKTFARSVWSLSLLFGWDISQMSELLQRTLDRFPIPHEEQFWTDA